MASKALAAAKKQSTRSSDEPDTANADGFCGGCFAGFWKPPKEQRAALKNDISGEAPEPAAPAAQPAPAAKAAAPAAQPAPTAKVNDEAIKKFHMKLRWNKPWAEVLEVASGFDLKTLSCAQDPKNGNSAIHIAAQNGHVGLCRELIALGVDVDAKNGKGNTSLHMSSEYDFYFTSRLLLDSGASGSKKNQDGNEAIRGIEGSKVDDDCYDNPVYMLKDASSQEDLDFAFAALEKALDASDHGLVSKEKLIQTGLSKKKDEASKEIWDHKRFMSLAAKF